MNDRRPASSSETVDGTAAPEPGTPALPHISGDAQDVSSLPTAPASRHGQFRILRPHARGGLGQVSLAMDETLGRTVAVKEIRADIAQNAHTRRRFVQEAEVTGQLEHPNIVPIYALGQDEHGRPYYAMRFVDGQTLEQLIAAYHAAPTPLAFQDLLRRFVAVCQAMAYAHSQEIIHRDLKPANIMTGRYGETLILDWGLAKRLNGIPTQKPQHESSAEQAVELPALSGGGETLAGQAVGTPAYMPPEQAGSSVDRPSASADIYALGAILYHILTNHPPHHGDSRTQVISRAARAEVARPSSLKAKLPKALEAVCVKAMARRPEDRYASATELAQEIERYLADEPVAAYRQPLLTTAARWARRHKPAVAAAAALLITAVVALAISNVLVARQRNATVRAERLAQSRLITEREAHREADAARRQAETERDRAVDAERRAAGNFAKARSAITDYLAKVSESELLKVPGLQPLRRDLLTSSLGFYQELLKEQAGHSGLQAELADAYLRAGQIYSDLGSTGEATMAIREARARFEVLSKAEPADPALQVGLAESLHLLGYYPEAAAIWEALLVADPGNVRSRRQLSDVYNSLALGNRSDVSRTMDFHQKALVLREGLVQEAPDDPEARNALGSTLNNIAAQLMDVEGRQEEALGMCRQAIQHAGVAFDRAPQVVEFGTLLAIAHHNMALIEQQLGRAVEAIGSAQEALRIRKKLATDNPALPAMQSQLGTAYWHLALLYREADQDAEAAAAFGMARDTIQRLPKETADDYFILACVHALCSEMAGRGDTQLNDQEREEQIGNADAAMEALRGAIAAGMTNVNLLKEDRDLNSLRERDDFKALTAQVEEIAKANDLLRQKGGPRVEQLKAEQEAASIFEKLVEQDPQGEIHLHQRALARYAMGLSYVSLRRFDEAETALREALALREQVAQARPDKIIYKVGAASSHLGLGELHWERERWPEAVDSWKLAVELLQAAARDHPSSPLAADELNDAHRNLFPFYTEAGLWGEAASHAAEAYRDFPEPTARQSFTHATLRLAGGDVAGYEHVRRRAFQRHGSSNDGTALLEVLRTMTLGPDPQVPPERLIGMAQEALKPFPKVSGRLGWTGMAYYRTGRYDEALPWFERSYVADRTWPVAYAMLALVYHRLGDEPAAREWLARTDRYLSEICEKTLAGTSLDIPGGWGIYHGCMEAETLRREAATLINRSPATRNPWFALVRARAYARLGTMERAETELQAVEQAPPDAKLLAARGRVFAEVEQHERAEADFAQASQIEPLAPAPWVMLARYRAERGQTEEADAALAKAAELAGNDLYPLIQAGGWWVVGPFAGNALTSPTSVEQEADPSRPVTVPATADGKSALTLAWRSAPADHWANVDLAGEFGAAEDASVYALAHVYCSAARTATFLIAGDDQIRVWVNGQRVHEAFRLVDVQQSQRITVSLRAGRNTILVKVWNQSGRFFFRLRSADSPYDSALAAHDEGLAAETFQRFDFWRSEHSLNSRPFELMRMAEAAHVSGQTSEFRRIRALLRLYARPEYVTAEEAWETARVLTEFPDSGIPPPVLLALAQRGATASKQWYAQLPLAVAHYRAGQFQEAIRLAEEIDPDASLVCTYPLRAMAYHQLGQTVDARTWLSKTDGWYHQTLQEAVADRDGKIGYGDWFHFLILRDEATVLIEGKPPEQDDKQLTQVKQARARWLREHSPQSLDAMITNDPRNANLLSLRGRKLAEEAQWAKAATDYANVLDITRAVRGNEEWVSPWHDACQELAQWDDVFEEVAALRPDDLEIWIERGRYHLLRNRWKQAAECYGKVIESIPVGDPSVELACLRLLSDDAEAYRQLCARLVERSGKTTGPRQAFFLARTCAISSHSGIDPARIIRWGELAAKEGNAWALSALGMAHYRAGEYEQAITRLEESNALNWQIAGYAQNEFLLAMAHHQLGRAERARQTLAKAIQRTREVSPGSKDEPARCLPPDWVTTKLLHREAEALIKDPPAGEQDNKLPGAPPE